MRRLLCLLVLAAGTLACSSYSYVPEGRAIGTLSERTAPAYSFSLSTTQGRQGGISLASYGVAVLKQDGEDSVEAIHLRLSVSDNGDQPMILDTRAQRLRFPDGRQVSPARAASQEGVPPLIRVEPGSNRTVDLYFPVPPDSHEQSNAPEFDVVWRVLVGTYMVSDITPFDRTGVEPGVTRREVAEDIVDVFTVDRGSRRGQSLVGPLFWGWW